MIEMNSDLPTNRYFVILQYIFFCRIKTKTCDGLQLRNLIVMGPVAYKILIQFKIL